MFSLKDNLKTGNIVKLRNGDKGIVNLETKSIDLMGGGFMALKDYSEDLKVNVWLENFRGFDIEEIWEVQERYIKVQDTVKLYGRGDELGNVEALKSLGIEV